MTPATKRRRAKERKPEQLSFEIPSATRHYEVVYLPHDRIAPDPEQPRQDPDDELRDSIKANGLLQPITVRPAPKQRGHYLIVDGERRWRGAEGVLDRLPCLIRDDLEAPTVRLRTQVVANVGKPLVPVEEARAYQTLLADHDSIAALARAIGRPERSVADRLHLLDLGPWLPLIERGELPITHATKVLLPLRGCPVEVHEHAVLRAEKDYRFERNGNGKSDVNGISLHDFQSLVREVYGSAMYPLSKSKSTWEKQPGFDTKHHDAECSCGRIAFEISSTKRVCCGNPGWWRPKHRAAQKGNPKKAGARGRRETVEYALPPEAGTLTIKEYHLPKNFTALTSSHRPVWNAHDLQCDPAAVPLDPSKLLLVHRGGGGGTVVATKDTAWVQASRDAWESRWTGRRRSLADTVAQAFKKASLPNLGGSPGLIVPLLEMLADYRSATVIDAALAAGLDVPKALARVPAFRHTEPKGLESWVTARSTAEAIQLLTMVAWLCASEVTEPHEVTFSEREKAERAIEKKPVPWIARASSKNGKKPKRAVRAAVEPEDDEVEDDEVEEDEHA